MYQHTNTLFVSLFVLSSFSGYTSQIVKETSITVDNTESDSFNLQEYLIGENFQDYDKIAEPINNGDLTLQDLLDCSESDLTALCNDYNIKTVQKNRFVKAIKKLPNSNANNKNKPSFVFLTTNEQNNINKLSKLSTATRDIIAKTNEISDNSQANVTDSKNTIENLFIQLRQWLDNMEQEILVQVT